MSFRTFINKAAVATAALAGSVMTSGCSQGPVCQQLGSCGGNVVGVWVQKSAEAAGGNFCQERLHRVPIESYRLGQPVPVARVRVPEATNIDWCSTLLFGQGEEHPIKSSYFYWENLEFVNGILTYRDDGSYTLNFGRHGSMQTYFSHACLTQYGNKATCSEFAKILGASTEGANEYFGVECKDNATRGGCDCSYQVTEADSQSGVYKVDGNVVTHYPAGTAVHYSQALSCVRGDTLQLSGMDNSWLWDRDGLRTIEMHTIDCKDGVQGPGEDGIDCGPRCPNVCPEDAPKP